MLANLQHDDLEWKASPKLLQKGGEMQKLPNQSISKSNLGAGGGNLLCKLLNNALFFKETTLFSQVSSC